MIFVRGIANEATMLMDNPEPFKSFNFQLRFFFFFWFPRKWRNNNALIIEFRIFQKSGNRFEIYKLLEISFREI